MKKLGWSAYLNKKHLTAIVQKELRWVEQDITIWETVRESRYVKENEAFKMGDDDVRVDTRSRAQHQLPRGEDFQRTGAFPDRQQVNAFQGVGAIFGQGNSGPANRIQSTSQPAVPWDARRTIHSKRQNGLVVETPAVAAEDISPRRRPKVMQNEDVRAAQRSPRPQEQAPQANGQGGHMHDMKSSNGHVRSVVAGFEQPRNLAQSPRRQQGSGPPLASRGPLQSGQVPTSSPREDPCTLSVAQKAATIEARAASQPCRQQPIQPQPQPQGLHRNPTQQGFALRGAQGRGGSAPAGYPATSQHHFMPNSRSTIPMAQGAGRAVANVPVLGAAPPRVQQGAAAPQGFVVNGFSSRGRSSSPSGITAGQPTTMGYMHHPGQVQQRR